jgi:hypothetical protein
MTAAILVFIVFFAIFWLVFFKLKWLRLSPGWQIISAFFCAPSSARVRHRTSVHDAQLRQRYGRAPSSWFRACPSRSSSPPYWSRTMSR